MLTDPIKDFGPRLAQIAFGALFREPKQVVELDRDGDKVDVGGVTVTVDHTPGHTRGSVVFRVGRAGFSGGQERSDPGITGVPMAFTGDTLFKQTVVRTDLPGGNHEQLLQSIRTRIFTLPPETKVFAGHMEPTTVGHEIKHNPFL